MTARTATAWVLTLALFLLWTFDGPPATGADEDAKPAGGGARRGGPPWVFRTDVPAHDADVVLGRPTRDSVVLSLRSTVDAEGCVEWRRAGASEAARTPIRPLTAGSPSLVKLDGLAPDAAYVARLLWRRAPASEWVLGEELSFHTQRRRGATYAFTVQADSHLDARTDPTLYERTLRNVADSRPDFHVDLGDTFMTDKYREDFHGALGQYVAQRWYFGLARVPTFLVLGNHDGEVGWQDRGSGDDMPHWSNAQRKRLFPNPEPDGFYSGNEASDPLNGLLQNWYGWTWGDALFLALDPFWSTKDRGGRNADPWRWTLGEPQYRWLERMLTSNPAKFRFVLLHHLVGGEGGEARGGAEVARRYEWGGRSTGGRHEFAARRPGWSAPIHDLLVRAGPTVVLHGHDHFFAHQTLDGVVYQMVPQPGHPAGDVAKMAAEYGYVSGDFLSSPGHLRVQVSPDAATIEYVRASKAGPVENAKVVFSYRVSAAGK